MSKIGESILQAMETIIDERFSKLQYDKTIQAKIIKIEDANTGEYKVEYQNGIFSAFANDPKEKYRINDLVFVTIPEGDFNNKKFISHKITKDSLTTGQYSQLQQTEIEVSPEFSNLGIAYNAYDNGQEYWGITADIDSSNSKQILGSITLPEMLKAFFDRYEYIKIQALFRTAFNIDHTKGNYGVSITFVDDKQQEFTYSLDIHNFIGDPYHLWTWLPQSAIIKIPKNITGISEIKFWEKGFSEEPQSQDNIFLKDLSLSFVEILDLTDTPYYLNVTADQGIAFIANKVTKITLQSDILHYGNLIKPDKCIYKWFKRDLSISPTSNNYDQRAGWGWAPIDNATEENLEVYITDVPWQQTYKLVAIYQSDILMTKEITLINRTNQLVLSIVQTVEQNSPKLKITNSDYVGDWYYLDRNGIQQPITDSVKVNQTNSIAPYLNQSQVLFYCQVYLLSANKYIYQGELTYTMSQVNSKEDISVVFIGESLFSFSADGQIKAQDADEIYHSLNPEILFKEGVINSLSDINWLDFNGNIITDGENYDSTDSMITAVRVDSETKILYYKIRHNYIATSAKNNTFTLRLVALDGKIYTFTKEIIFIKAGDPGTNGTDYQSLIRVVKDEGYYSYVSPSATSQNLGNGVKLECIVYRGSTELLSSEVSYSWELYHLQSKNNLDEKTIIVYADSGNDYKRYVKVTVTIGQNILYNFFPIDTSSATFDNTLNLTELPKYIQYQTNGYHPIGRTQIPYIEYKKVAAVIKSEDTSIITINKKGTSFQFNSEFNPNNFVGLLSITFGKNVIYHPVPTYINTFGNEAINGWDGISVELNNEDSIFAPQIGAGRKDSRTNKFTGVIMGRDTSQQDKIGLYGYADGINTFGLKEDGEAYFGPPGNGRIIINGTDAIIKGGTKGGNEDLGMTIDLHGEKATDVAIKINKGIFQVDYNGKLIATQATIKGDISATGGTIGGWTINNNSIYSSNQVYLASDNTNLASFKVTKGSPYWSYTYNSSTKQYTLTSGGNFTASSEYDCLGVFTYNNKQYAKFKTKTSNTDQCVEVDSKLTNRSYYRIWASNASPYDAKFSITSNGILNGKNANLTGVINATSGYIGGTNGWIIQEGQIRSQSSTIGISATGKYTIWAGAEKPVDAIFSVAADGTLVATNANIRGYIEATSGYIGGWNLNNNRLESSYIDDQSSSTTAGYRIYLNGQPSEEDNKVIFVASKNKISKRRVKEKNEFYITKDGELFSNEATINGTINAYEGKIGPWTITDEGIVTINNQNISTGMAGLSTTGTSINGQYSILNLEFIQTLLSMENVDANEILTGSIYTSQSINNIAFWAGMRYSQDQQGRQYLEGDINNNGSNSFFAVTHDGKLYCRNALIQGAINVDNGYIGGWNIRSGKLYRGTVGLSAEGIAMQAPVNKYLKQGSPYWIVERSSSDNPLEVNVKIIGKKVAIEDMELQSVDSSKTFKYTISEEARRQSISKPTTQAAFITPRKKDYNEGYLIAQVKNIITKEISAEHIVFWAGKEYSEERNWLSSQSVNENQIYTVNYGVPYYSKQATNNMIWGYQKEEEPVGVTDKDHYKIKPVNPKDLTNRGNKIRFPITFITNDSTSNQTIYYLSYKDMQLTLLNDSYFAVEANGAMYCSSAIAKNILIESGTIADNGVILDGVLNVIARDNSGKSFSCGDIGGYHKIEYDQYYRPHDVVYIGIDGKRIATIDEVEALVDALRQDIHDASPFF